MMIFKIASVAGAAIISPTQTYHRSRARLPARSNRSEPGRSSCQLPARLITRIAARTGGDAKARSASRTAVSPGREGMRPTASASARKQPALAIRTPRRLWRGGKPGATAAAIADEPQHAPAAALVECHGAIALAAPVAGPPRTNHADHASDLSVRRLDVEDPVIRAVVLNRQEDGALPVGPVILPCHVPARLARPSIDVGGGRLAQPATSVARTRTARAGRGLIRRAGGAPTPAGACRRRPRARAAGGRR